MEKLRLERTIKETSSFNPTGINYFPAGAPVLPQRITCRCANHSLDDSKTTTAHQQFISPKHKNKTPTAKQLRFVLGTKSIYSFTSVVTAGAGFVHGVISSLRGVG